MWEDLRVFSCNSRFSEVSGTGLVAAFLPVVEPTPDNDADMAEGEESKIEARVVEPNTTKSGKGVSVSTYVLHAKNGRLR